MGQKPKTRAGTETLCWTCRKSTNSGCNWSRSFKPVQGWVAEKNRNGHGCIRGSYKVEYCPEYENDSCYIKRDSFWGECKGDCYSCGEWRDSYGNKFNKKGRQPRGEEEADV